MHLLLPGSIRQRTGGYRYDARIVDGLRGLGWPVSVHELAGNFPEPDAAGRAAVAAALAGVAAGEIAVVDGLCLSAAGPLLAGLAPGIGTVALVHHPAALETGYSTAAARALADGERAALAACDRVVVTSATTAALLAADYAVLPARLTVVEPGVDRAPVATGSGDGVPNLLCVGTVTARKGHGLLVAALTEITDLDWHLLCAGSATRDPVVAAAVRLAVQQAALADRVTFTGELADDAMDRAYDGADILVSAAHYEGYGMALTEGLARALPIVATAGGAVARTVPEDAGLIVPGGDARSLAAALRRVLEDSGLRQALTAGALRARASLAGWDDTTARFAGVLSGAPW